jgi:hypothetical protein
VGPGLPGRGGNRRQEAAGAATSAPHVPSSPPPAVTMRAQQTALAQWATLNEHWQVACMHHWQHFWDWVCFLGFHSTRV